MSQGSESVSDPWLLCEGFHISEGESRDSVRLTTTRLLHSTAQFIAEACRVPLAHQDWQTATPPFACRLFAAVLYIFRLDSS